MTEDHLYNCQIGGTGPNFRPPATSQERRAGHLSLVAVAAVLLACVLLAGGCTTAKPSPPPRTESSWPVVKDSVAPTHAAITPAPPVTPGILSGIGRLFSTPAGIERRHARKLAKATVPRHIGKGAVYAPWATEVVNAYKSKAPVINADSGATVTAIEKVKAPLAIGAGATATSTTVKGISYWWLLLLLIPAAWWGYKKTLPFA